MARPSPILVGSMGACCAMVLGLERADRKRPEVQPSCCTVGAQAPLAHSDWYIAKVPSLTIVLADMEAQIVVLTHLVTNMCCTHTHTHTLTPHTPTHTSSY